MLWASEMAAFGEAWRRYFFTKNNQKLLSGWGIYRVGVSDCCALEKQNWSDTVRVEICRKVKHSDIDICL